jgi:hypothetical protein
VIGARGGHLTGEKIAENLADFGGFLLFRAARVVIFVQSALIFVRLVVFAAISR